MTVADLLNQVTYGADNDDGTYRIAVLRWLNLCRSEAYNEASWRTAVQADATITTAAATTDGLYALANHEHVVSQYMWDETNTSPVAHASYQDLQSVDPAKDTTGSPSLWADAGIENTTSGDRRVYLWPIPDGTHTIRFTGYRKYKDLVTENEDLAVDPLFGELGDWAAAFAAGMRYYQDLDNNESGQQAVLQERRWKRMLLQRKKRNGVLPNVLMQLSDIRHLSQVQQGRFDPGHYNNQ